ncbi:MAG: 16S rRNA (guanine(966)-N(2))-methyltransferase RsmD [bacterium]
MRVIAGTKKGVRLSVVKVPWIRPTSDSVKELIFNVLGDEVESSLVLDLFAGTGSLGIEALSRGAAKAIFIEKTREAQRLIENNLRKTRLTNKAEVLKTSTEMACKKLSKQEIVFDLIFADPPYGRRLASQTLTLVAQFHLLAAQGRLVIEHSFREVLSESVEDLTLGFQKRQGESTVSFYRHVQK